jgi:hypothetical protein
MLDTNILLLLVLAVLDVYLAYTLMKVIPNPSSLDVLWRAVKIFMLLGITWGFSVILGDWIGFPCGHLYAISVGVYGFWKFVNIYGGTHDESIGFNPASGLPMCGAVDCAGNEYGFDSW